MEIAKKYHVNRNTLQSHITRGGWARNKKENETYIEEQVIEKTVNAIIDKKVEVNKRHIQLVDDSLDIVAELLQVYKVAIKEKKFKQVNAKNMDYLVSALLKAQKAQRLALNLDKDSDTLDDEPEINTIKGLDIGKV